MKDGEIDYGWRPKSYEAEERTANNAVSHLQGHERVNAVRNILRDDRQPRQWKIFFAIEELDEMEASWAGVSRPLRERPDYSTVQIEIARISWASVHGDSCSITAQKVPEGLEYTVTTDIFAGEAIQPEIYQPLSSRGGTLTLGELIELIDGSYIEGDAYARGGLVKGNWEMNLEVGGSKDALAGVQIDSAYYPDLVEHYNREGNLWLAERTDPDDEESDS